MDGLMPLTDEAHMEIGKHKSVQNLNISAVFFNECIEYCHSTMTITTGTFFVHPVCCFRTVMLNRNWKSSQICLLKMEHTNSSNWG